MARNPRAREAIGEISRTGPRHGAERGGLLFQDSGEILDLGRLGIGQVDPKPGRREKRVGQGDPPRGGQREREGTS
jgi:hypothetical protein